MPIYEYECQKCGCVFEMMQSISARPLKNHVGADCKGKVKRLVSASGFILKGDGWYANDYPSDSRKKGWEQEKKEANPETNSKHTCGTGCNHSASTPDSKSDSKIDAKTKTSDSKAMTKSPYSSKKRSKTSKS